MPLEIFDDFLTENERIKQVILSRSREEEPNLKARSYYFHLDGTVEEKDAEVLDYDSDTKKYLIQFESQGKILKKHCGRMNLQFIEFETREQIEQRRSDAQALRKEAAMRLTAEKFFINEMA